MKKAAVSSTKNEYQRTEVLLLALARKAWPGASRSMYSW
jgi:hypothetical protein